jgi:hypothetical protein
VEQSQKIVSESKEVRTINFDKEIRLDNTKRSTFVRCPRKFLLEHILGLRSAMGNTALRFGGTWHKVMEGFYGYIKDNGWENRDQAIHAGLTLGKMYWDAQNCTKVFYEDYRTWEACTELFMGYLSEYSNDENIIKVIATEQVFACPVTINEGGEMRMFGELPPIVFTGKLDKQIALDNSPFIEEFKTTGQPLSIQEARLRRNPQVLGYAYGAKKILDFDVQGVLVSLAHISARKNKDGVYGKNSTGFKRVPQIFSPYDLQAWKIDFLSTCLDIYQRWNRDYFEMRHDGCYTYGQCAYARLCEQSRYLHVSKDTDFSEPPEGYVVEFWDVEDTDD